MRSGLSYEFRTTVVKELHDIETMAEIADFISGADKYFLQGYEDSDRVIARGFSAYTRQELEGFKTVLKGNNGDRVIPSNMINCFCKFSFQHSFAKCNV